VGVTVPFTRYCFILADRPMPKDLTHDQVSLSQETCLCWQPLLWLLLGPCPAIPPRSTLSDQGGELGLGHGSGETEEAAHEITKPKK
jgi:hypothetical protein